MYLTEVQRRRLAAMAKALGMPMAELIRQGVDLILRQKVTLGQDPLLDLVGQAGAAGRSDIAAQHDMYQAGLFQDTERK
ncbi:MAG: hypothetical protein ACE5JN_16330 [Candidatus Methylomirabilia bacterium]